MTHIKYKVTDVKTNESVIVVGGKQLLALAKTYFPNENILTQSLVNSTKCRRPYKNTIKIEKIFPIDQEQSQSEKPYNSNKRKTTEDGWNFYQFKQFQNVIYFTKLFKYTPTVEQQQQIHSYIKSSLDKYYMLYFDVDLIKTRIEVFAKYDTLNFEDKIHKTLDIRHFIDYICSHSTNV